MAYSMKMKYWLGAVAIGMMAVACNPDNDKTDEQPPTQDEPTATSLVEGPAFNEDSAYAFVAKQVSFGPRVPGTKGHAQCADWLLATLKRFSPEVMVQKGEVKTFDGKTFQLKNIIAHFNPKASRRIMLSAHWDTRPFADQDSKDQNKPIDGANDGASGVGVLLELARQFNQKLPADIGVDIFLWDLEDYGQPENSDYPEMEDSYCLGSQFWAKQPHKPGYTAAYGILLDMVGGPGAQFVLEEVSVRYAGNQMARLWGIAQQIGYQNYFLNVQGSPIIDDHYYINMIAKIPTFDIIHRDGQSPSGFAPYWHTHRDNLDNVSKPTLKAVGQTVLTTLWNE